MGSTKNKELDPEQGQLCPMMKICINDFLLNDKVINKKQGEKVSTCDLEVTDFLNLEVKKKDFIKLF